ncbi:MAG: hypothetical protein GF381_00300 [Candidatus Pacebacteria bacterium]|nr:hypothetical protein [Candidatus Paceibacterota bacterium]
MKKTNFLILLVVVLLMSVVSFGVGQVWAEQSGSSPDSGATSYIKTIYDSLTSLAHGDEAAGAWGDWGSYWNRIRSAAEWVPDGGDDAATPADVASGKNFYATSRTQETGTLTVIDYSTQKNLIYDDWKGSGDCAASLADAFANNQDQCKEEGSWT